MCIWEVRIWYHWFKFGIGLKVRKRLCWFNWKQKRGNKSCFVCVKLPENRLLFILAINWSENWLSKYHLTKNTVHRPLTRGCHLIWCDSAITNAAGTAAELSSAADCCCRPCGAGYTSVHKPLANSHKLHNNITMCFARTVERFCRSEKIALEDFFKN